MCGATSRIVDEDQPERSHPEGKPEIGDGECRDQRDREFADNDADGHDQGVDVEPREITLVPGRGDVVEEVRARHPRKRCLLHFLQCQRAGDEGEVKRQAYGRRAEQQHGVAEDRQPEIALDHGYT